MKTTFIWILVFVLSYIPVSIFYYFIQICEIMGWPNIEGACGLSLMLGLIPATSAIIASIFISIREYRKNKQ